MTQQSASSRQGQRPTKSKRISAETSDRERKPAAEVRNPVWWSALQGAERHARYLAVAADAGYRDCSCRCAEREAQSPACKCSLLPSRAH